MALNFLNSRGSTEESPEATDFSTDTTTDTTASAEDTEPAPPSRRRRRGTRGGRSSGASSTAAATEAAPESDGEEKPAPARATARRRKADDEEEPAPRPTRRRASATKASEDEPEPPKRAAPRRRSRAATAKPEEGEAALLAALKEQNEKLTRLVELQEQTIGQISGGGSGAVATGAATLPRVGIFVDSANVELARDRSRGGKSIDWGLVLERLTQGRRLVRAVAYSPVHDDPGVSRETQRFVEPFLGKGYKIVTKPLKRFADGSIKANVDIELALDLITMSDRLDIAVLISGDGDFQHLVEVVQGRGVRVEVAGMGQSVAGSLKNAADRYIELDFAQKK